MDQLERIDQRVQPDQVYLVVDGMTGQDAVNSAKAFNEALELDGVIMTKLDGDARGGALLSRQARHRRADQVHRHRRASRRPGAVPPEGMAGRILGMGDIVGLVEQAQQKFDQDEMAASKKSACAAGEFTLDDFKKQLGR